MKHYGKLTAAAAAGFMALSAMGVAPVFAETVDGRPTVGANNSGNYTITKTLDLGEKDLKPADAMSFKFTISQANGDYATWNESIAPEKTISGYMPAVGFGADLDKTVTAAANDAKTTYTADLTINASAFPGPGTYVYTLKEDGFATDGAENNGVTNDTLDEYSLQVLVVKDANGNNEIKAVVAKKAGEDDKSETLAFSEASYNPGTVTMTKSILGNQALSSDTFTFAVKIAGQDGEEYSYRVGNTGDWIPIVNNEATNITVGSQAANNTIYIRGLSEGDSYTITETNSKGYTPTNNKNIPVTDAEGNTTVVDGSTTNVVELTTTDDTSEQVDFTNTKDGAVPTGILMTAAPYAGLVGLGGIFAGLFFRRKRED